MQVGQLSLVSTEQDDGALSSATIVLEPCNGGDLSVVTDDYTVVEQIKSRSDNRAWSLREIAEKVLPDLYLAARSIDSQVKFRFVTEGRIGQWKDVLNFFKSLCQQDLLDESIVDQPSFSDEISFRRSSSKAESFWGEGSYTKRRLIERVVDEVRKRKEVGSEDLCMTQRNVLRMLANLEFEWECTTDNLQLEIDSCLAAVVNTAEEIPNAKRDMAMDLAEIASSGNARIDPNLFFQKHRLDAIPLSNWSSIRQKSVRVLQRELEIRRYDAQSDVRSADSKNILNSWSDSTPIVVVESETGYGKSWQLFALANSQKHAIEIPVYVEARGQIDDTLSHIGRIISERIWGQDQPLSLERIAKRRRLFHPSEEWWILLLIDNVQDPEEANQLALQPWEDWGVRVAIACHPSVSLVIQDSARDRAKASCVTEFSVEQTHQFLEYHVSGGWSDIPQDVMQMLRRPLLAQLFVDVVSNHSLSPTNEYELYDAYWKRIQRGDSTLNPLDEARLKTLVKGFIAGNNYPWTASQLLESDLSDSCIDRLLRAGWLVRTAEQHFAIAHDRLLNWVVAQTLVEDLRQESISISELGKWLKGFSFGNETIQGKYLGYVAMDVIWLIANDTNLTEALSTLIPLLEHHPIHTEDLYEKHLPTIGPSIVDALIDLLNSRKGVHYYQRHIIDGLCKLGGERLEERTKEMLNSDDPWQQRYALLILAQHPQEQCLSRIWDLHAAINWDPNPWLEEHDSKYYLFDNSYDALLANCRLHPDWIIHTARSANPKGEPFHTLAYLVSELDPAIGRTIWNSAKSDLMLKMPFDKDRSLATCMWHFPDSADKGWLEDRLDREDDLVGLSCFKALVRIDSKSAVDKLGTLSPTTLYRGSTWWFCELFTRHPNATRKNLLDLMKSGSSIEDIAECYRGNEHLIDTATLELLLEELDQRISVFLGDVSPNRESIYSLLLLIAATNTADQLACIERYQGSSLEQNLTDFIATIGARHGVGQDSLSREPAIELLFRIGGMAFTSIVNRFMESDSQYGRLDALKLAIKRPDEETLRICKTIAKSDVTWDDKGIPFEQNEAAVVLIASGHMEPIVDFFEQWWPEVYTDLTEPMESAGPLPEATRWILRKRIEASMPSPNPGLVDLLGFSDNAEDVTLVRTILANSDAGEELVRASLLSIERLGDNSEMTVPLLESRLRSEKDTRRLTRIALTTNGTDQAYDVLLKHYSEEYNLALAINLLNDSRTCDRAVELTKKHLRETKILFWSRDLLQLMKYVRDSEPTREILEDTVLRNRVLSLAFMEEGRSWVGGTKAGAIRAVAAFDKPKAIEATKIALQNPEGHEREVYAYLLVDLLGLEAVVPLMELLGEDLPKYVRVSIARALSTISCTDHLGEYLKLDDPLQSLSACRAVGYRMQDYGLIQNLEGLLDSCHDELIEEALQALDRIRRQQETGKLITAICSTKNQCEQWILIVALLEISDPGDQNRPLPIWAKSIWNCLTPFMRKYVQEDLGKRRKKLFDEMQRAN